MPAWFDSPHPPQIRNPQSAIPQSLPIHPFGAFVVNHPGWSSLSSLAVADAPVGPRPPRRIAVRVNGGRIGNVTMMVENEPVFTVGERSLLFLIRQTVPSESVAAGIDDGDYYRVGYSEWGKCRFKDGETVYLRQDEVALATIEEKIAELRGAE